MNDAELLAAFEDTTLEPFHHADHIRMAWIYLRKYGLLEAITRFIGGLKRYAESRGVPDRYHETITLAFLLLVYERMAPDEPWDAFAARHDDLLRWNPSALASYYRAETLATNDARARFVLPDVQP
jgi:hypothetical protein